MSRWHREHPDYDEDDGLPIAVFPPVVRCKCSHGEAQHGTDRRGRLICYGSSVCGCIQFRRKDEPSIPARFDERYDPSPEPIDRSIQ